MAVSDAMLAIIIALIGLYIVLYNSRSRHWRIIGSLGIIIVGWSTIAIEDTVIMFVLFGICIIIGIKGIMKEVGNLI